MDQEGRTRQRELETTTTAPDDVLFEDDPAESSFKKPRLDAPNQTVSDELRTRKATRGALISQLEARAQQADDRYQDMHRRYELLSSQYDLSQQAHQDTVALGQRMLQQYEENARLLKQQLEVSIS